MKIIYRKIRICRYIQYVIYVCDCYITDICLVRVLMIAFQFQVNDEDHSIVVDQSFQIPDAGQEDSIQDESIGDVPEADNTV